MIKLITVYEGAIFEDTGINRIAAFLEERGIYVTTDYIKCNSEINSELLDMFKGYKYVGFSVYDSNFDYVQKLSAKIKEQFNDIIIFYGSQYITISYEYVINMDNIVDFLVLGDGEYPIYDFVKQYNGSNMDEIINDSPHLVSRNSSDNKKPCFIDINQLPWPKHNETIMRKHLYTSLKTSNGCLGDCGFCGYVRRKWSGYSPQEILNEIRRIREKYNIRSIMFADNSFEDPGEKGKERINDFLECLKQDNEKYSFFANIRAESFKNNPKDIELLRKMRKYGFSQLFVGIESGNEEDLILYNKKATLQENHDIINILKRCDIMPKWGFIMINPYSNKERLRQNYYFLSQHKSHDLFHYMSYLMIYINSKLYYQVKKDGLANEMGNKPIRYDFIDPYAKSVYDFIRNEYENTSFQIIARKMKDSLLIYYHLKPLLNLKDDLIDEIKLNIAKENEKFFGILYDEFNLDKAKDRLYNFSNKIFQYSKVIENLKMQAVKSYLKIYS